jgi:hypothetical protein
MVLFSIVMIVENYLEEKIIYKDTWNNTTINMEVEQKDLKAVTKTINSCKKATSLYGE